MFIRLRKKSFENKGTETIFLNTDTIVSIGAYSNTAKCTAIFISGKTPILVLEKPEEIIEMIRSGTK